MSLFGVTARWKQMGTVLYRIYLEYCPKVKTYCNVFVAKMEKHRLEDGGGDVDGS